MSNNQLWDVIPSAYLELSAVTPCTGWKETATSHLFIMQGVKAVDAYNRDRARRYAS
jgi:hypothetical protein